MRYRFTAQTAEGETKTGFLEATDPADAGRQLQRRKLLLVELEAEDSEAPSYIRQQPAAPVPLPPAPTRAAAPSVWSQLDRRKLLAGATLALAGLLGISWLSSRLLGTKNYRLHLVGHLALVSRKELEADYMDRVQLGLRLDQPAWQIDRDGTIEAKDASGKYHPIGQKARVQFQIGVEGDYTLDVDVPLPKAPVNATFFVEAPGFPSASRVARLAAAADRQALEARVQPLSVKQLKKRETRATAQAAPDAPAAGQAPKYDSNAPEPTE